VAFLYLPVVAAQAESLAKQAKLCITETNTLRQITHLTLSLTAPSDIILRKHLMDMMKTYRQEVEQLKLKLTETQKSLSMASSGSGVASSSTTTATSTNGSRNLFSNQNMTGTADASKVHDAYRTTMIFV
jgi:hypothetical protein